MSFFGKYAPLKLTIGFQLLKGNFVPDFEKLCGTTKIATLAVPIILLTMIDKHKNSDDNY